MDVYRAERSLQMGAYKNGSMKPIRIGENMTYPISFGIKFFDGSEKYFLARFQTVYSAFMEPGKHLYGLDALICLN